MRTDSLDGKKVLLVGYGGMGKAIEERLAPFGARITRASRTARDGVAPLSQLPRLAAEADILVVCIALTPDTCGLIGEEVLGALPDGALVVNVARGPIVDAVALVRHLTDRAAARGPRRHRRRAAARGPAGVGAAQRADHPAHRR